MNEHVNFINSKLTYIWQLVTETCINTVALPSMVLSVLKLNTLKPSKVSEAHLISDTYINGFQIFCYFGCSII